MIILALFGACTLFPSFSDATGEGAGIRAMTWARWSPCPPLTDRWRSRGAKRLEVRQVWRVFSSSLWLCDCSCASRSHGMAAGVTQWGLFLTRGTFTPFFGSARVGAFACTPGQTGRILFSHRFLWWDTRNRVKHWGCL